MRRSQSKIAYMRVIDSSAASSHLHGVRESARRVQFDEDDEQTPEHSIHHLVPFRSAALPVLRPSTARGLISSLSPRRGVVLDPMCGTGTIALESHLLGRKVLATDPEPLFSLVTRAKLEPIDIAAAALSLQNANFRKPVSLEPFHQGFNAFFDQDTFRELSCLRAALRELTAGDTLGGVPIGADPARIGRYLTGVTLGILHGHTVGHISAYASPYESIAPLQQERLNRDRGAVPSYRAVVPRILRKVSHLSRDCRPSQYAFHLEEGQVNSADPRALAHIPSGSVDLVCTALPVPGAGARLQGQWLRLWCCGDSVAPSRGGDIASVDEWREWTGETLFELARVTRSGGYGAFVVGEARDGRFTLPMHEILTSTIGECFNDFWKVSEVLTISNNTSPLKASRSNLLERSRAGAKRDAVTLGLRPSQTMWVVVARRK